MKICPTCGALPCDHTIYSDEVKSLADFRRWLTNRQQPSGAGTESIGWLDPKQVLEKFEAGMQEMNNARIPDEEMPGEALDSASLRDARALRIAEKTPYIGTALDAINYALDQIVASMSAAEFLENWRLGDIYDYPGFTEWLSQQPKT